MVDCTETPKTKTEIDRRNQRNADVKKQRNLQQIAAKRSRQIVDAPSQPPTVVAEALQEQLTPHTEGNRFPHHATTLHMAEDELNFQHKHELELLKVEYDAEVQRHRHNINDHQHLLQESTLYITKYVELVERNRRIEEDNEQKTILCTTALQEIHQLTEENQLLKTKSDAAEAHHRTTTATQTDNRELRR